MLSKSKKISGRDLAVDIWIGANIATIVVITLTVIAAFSQ